MLRKLLLTGLISGIAAGVAVSLLQEVRVTPLILEAETYERKATPPHPPPEGSPSASARPSGHNNTAGGGEPARFWFTLAANLAIGMGYAFMLAGAFGLHGAEMSPGRGVLWGLAGFATFAVAPALGLPPELPGAPVADVMERQVWWLATVGATGAGLALVLLQRRRWGMVLGGVLIVLPHLVGAPHGGPAAGSALPPGLEREFVTASLVTGAAFWLTLGGVSGWVYRRLS